MGSVRDGACDGTEFDVGKDKRGEACDGTEFDVGAGMAGRCSMCAGATERS